MMRVWLGLAVAALMGLAGPWASANDWGQMALVSRTLGINANRLCLGEATRGDIGCPTYAPTVDSAGLLTAPNISITTNLTVAGSMTAGSAGFGPIAATYASVTAISATGNISANQFIGDGSLLTNINAGSVVGYQGDTISSTNNQAAAVARSEGTVSFTLGGTEGAAYLHPSLGLVASGVSTTGGISGSTGYFTASILLPSNIIIGDVSTSANTQARSHIVIGKNAHANTNISDAASYGYVVIGDNAYAEHNHGGTYKNGLIAIGYNAISSNQFTTAIGAYAQATDWRSQAFGYSAQATAQESLAVGHSARGSANNSVAIGNNALSSGWGGTAIGNGAQATGDRSTAIGQSALALGSYAIAVGVNTSAVTGTLNIANIIYGNIVSPKIGISTTTPSTSLHIAGTLRIANGGEACDTDRAGAIKYASGTFYFCSGSAWQSLGDIAAASSDRITSGTTNVIARTDGSISFTTAGTTTGYFYNGRLVANGISTTGTISGTEGYFSGNVGIGTAAFGYAARSPLEVVDGLRLTTTVWGNPAHNVVLSTDADANLLVGSGKIKGGTSGALILRAGHSNGYFISVDDRLLYQGQHSGNSNQSIHTFKALNAVYGDIAGLTTNMVLISGSTNTTAAKNHIGQKIEIGDVSSGYANNIIGLYSDVSYGTNTSANRYAGIFVGGGVGISTTAPSTSLHVAGTLRLADGGEACDADRAGAIKYSGSTFYFCSGSAWQSLGDIAAASSDRITSGTTNVIARTDGSISFTTAGTTTGYFYNGRLVANGISTTGTISGTEGYFSGNVGIGTRPSTYPLEVSNSIAIGGLSSQRLVLTGSTTRGYIGWGGTNVIKLFDDRLNIQGHLNVESAYDFSTDVDLIYAGGVINRVGIRTLSPTTLLDVSGTLRIANGGEACDTDRAGAIRYANGDFQVCYGSGGWASLVDASGTTVTPDRITSGTTNVYARADGSISFTTAGTTTGYFYNGQLVANAVSTTGGISGSTGYFSGNVGINAQNGSAGLYIEKAYYESGIQVNHAGTTSNGKPAIKITQGAGAGGVAGLYIRRGKIDGLGGVFYGTTSVTSLTPSNSEWFSGIGRSPGGAGFRYVIAQLDSGDSIENNGNGFGSQYRFVVAEDGKVGISTSYPKVSLHVAGTLRLADGGEACDTDRAGGIRYNSGTFEFCNGGGTWQSLSAAAGVSAPDWYAITHMPTQVAEVSNSGAIVMAGISSTNASVTTNLTVGGALTAGSAGFGPIAATSVDTAGLTVTGNSVVAAISATDISASGTISALKFIGDGSLLTNLATPTLALDDLSDVLTTYSSASIYLGQNSGASATGTSNTAVGTLSLMNNTTGYSNTGAGTQALSKNTTGYSNTGLGAGTLQENTTGLHNTAVGNASLGKNTTGNYNTANGSGSLYSNTSGYSNTANGRDALRANTTGYNNTAYGREAMYSNTTGYANAIMGINAFRSNLTGVRNTGVGSEVGYNTTGSYNIFLGYQSGYNVSSGSSNTLVGSGTDTPDPTTSNFINIANTLYGDSSAKKVGVNITYPSTSLHLAGALRLADGGEACDTDRAGAIKYSGSTFYFCSGSAWQSLGDIAAASSDRITSGTTNVYARADGSISFTTAGTTTGYFYNGQLVANAVSTTGAISASASGYFGGKLKVSETITVGGTGAEPCSGASVGEIRVDPATGRLQMCRM